MTPPLRFELLATDPTGARRGRIHTHHGTIETPVFMPVGTYGAVKTLHPDEVGASGARILLGNTFHLSERPGEALVERFGGLHRFMGWDGSILTDSGGFQVYSLAAMRKIDENGVTFRSPLTGDLVRFTPERAVEIQARLGTDIAMVLDECPPADATDESVLREAARRTGVWARRCLAARAEAPWLATANDDAARARLPALFGIVQGATNLALRSACVEDICGLPFDGFAVGGLAVGESKDATYATVAHTAPLMPVDKPRYLMGMGTPDDLVTCIGLGIDMFDCVMPTRNARNGQVFTRNGKLTIKNAAHREDARPLEEGCDCPACTRFTRAYLRHLYVTREILALRLLTLHNLFHYQRLMADARAAIEAGTFAAFRAQRLAAAQAAVD